MTAPTSPPTAPFVPPPPGWATEPAKADEPAGPRSQVAVYVVCAVAIGIVCGAGGVLEWGVAGMLALAAGVAIGILADLGPRFRSIPGVVAACMVMGVLLVLLVFTGGPASVFACVPLVGAFVLGLDWHLVRRLRPLPFAFGFLVVVGVSGGERWTYAAGLLWLVLALGALASLEADRRAGRPQVVAVTGGPTSDGVRTGDLATTILVAVAIALVAALVLSTPSCQRSNPDPPQSRPFDTPLGNGGSGAGGGEAGGGNGTGGSGAGSGGSTGSGTGSGSGTSHLYVPDPDGRFLIPNDGSSGSGSDSSGVPSPELLPEPGTPGDRTTLQDGTTIETERSSDGTGRIVVQEPDGTTRTYTYRERSDGLTEIRGTDDEGNPERPLYYDPQGRVATDDEQAVGGSSSGSGSEQRSQEDDKDEDSGESSHLDGRLLALIALVLAALGALVWWLSRRKPAGPPPDAPPWAVRLAREIDREGAARGPARRRSQSLAGYAADLRTGPLPDPRLADVADVVSTALFGRTDPGPEAQRWAEATWAQIVADHPVPSRADRRKARAGAGSR